MNTVPDTFLLILFAMLATVLVWGIWIDPWLRQRGRHDYGDGASAKRSSFYLMGLEDGSRHSPAGANDCAPADSGVGAGGCETSGSGDGGGSGGGGGD